MCFLAVGLAVATYVFYEPWRIANLNRDARVALERGDSMEAALIARRALQLDSGDVAASELLAVVAEIKGDPGAVALRERVVELTGPKVDALLACAATALRFGRLAVAQRALMSVPPEGKGRLDCVLLSGQLALAGGDYESAQRLFGEAARFEPNNPSHRFQLARARLGSADLLTRDGGRRDLEELAEVPQFRLPALQALVATYLASDEPLAALRAMRKLQEVPQHPFADDLVYLQLLRRTLDGAFPAALVEVEEKAALNARDAGALLVWMSAEGLASEAIDYALKKKPHVGKMQDVRPALAACYMVLGEWQPLLDATQKGPWQKADHVRHAYRARALRELGNQSVSRTEWDLATAAAARDGEALTWMAKTAKSWDWAGDEERALWALLDFAPETLWAVDRLQRKYLEEKNTLGLRRLAALLLSTDPHNETAQNDLAMASLLLGREIDRAERIATDLYKKNPRNAAIVSTYAFALFVQSGMRRPSKSLKNCRQRFSRHRRSPSITGLF